MAALVDLMTHTPLIRTIHSTRSLVTAARAAFSSRRKILRNALAGGLKIAPALAERALAEARIDPKVRAEVLEVANFARLGGALCLWASWVDTESPPTTLRVCAICG